MTVPPDPQPAPRFLDEARETIKLALPIVAGQLGQMMLHFVDGVMVGRVGKLPLAASAFANAVVSVFFVVGIGVLTSIGVRASQAHGAGRSRDSGEALRHGLWLSIGLGLLIGVLGEVTQGLLDRFGQTPEVVAEARNFFRLLCWSMVPAMVWQALKQYCEAMHRPLAPMLTVLGGVPLNAGLNWILIYGNFGAPALGLTGAGISTLITRIALVVVLANYVFRSPLFSTDLHGLSWRKRPDGGELHSMLALGLPVGLQLLLEVACFGFAAVMMGWLGEVPLAAHQIAITYAATTFMFPLGVSFAVSVRMGSAAGAGEHARWRRIGFSGLALGGAIMACGALIFTFAGRPLAALFVTDANVLALAVSLLAVAGLFQLVDGLQVVAMAALRGLSDVKIPVVIAFVSYWVVAIPAAWFLGFRAGWGGVGVWYGLAAGLACAAGSLGWRLWFKTR